MAASHFVIFVGSACRPGGDEREMLAHDGLRCLWTADVPQARRAARLARFDAVVVDAGTLEAPFGLALARLRDLLDCPMVVIGAEPAGAGPGEEIEEIVALEIGAEVYLRRPLSARRLRAHLAALLRRMPTAPAEAMAEAGPVRGLPALTSVQAALLNCLVAAQGRIVQRDELIAALPEGHSARNRTVDTHVHRLRRRLASTGLVGLNIDSVHGRGYVLRAEPDELAVPLAGSRAAA